MIGAVNLRYLMLMRTPAPAMLLVLYPALAIPQSQPAPGQAVSVIVKAGKLLDVRMGKYTEDGGSKAHASRKPAKLRKCRLTRPRTSR
jgi:hypothetical protein